MAILASDILDNPCDNDDEKMETIYQIDFIKKGISLLISQRNDQFKQLHLFKMVF